MAAKRLAELRTIGDRQTLTAYRRSFRGYTEPRLLASMVFYLVSGALMGGVFVVRYKVELVLGVPVYAAFFAAYMALSMRHDSPVQHPERLYKEGAFFSLALLTCLTFVGLMVPRSPGAVTRCSIWSPPLSSRSGDVRSLTSNARRPPLGWPPDWNGGGSSA